MDNNLTEDLPAATQKILASKTGANPDQVAQRAIADGTVLRGILKGILSKADAYRYNCFKVLLQIGENQPELLYPEWDYFFGLLRSDNSYHRSMGLQLIASLTRVDTEKRFEAIFDPYFDLLDDESMITARYLARNAGKIARAKPDLQRRITARLLGIDQTHHDQSGKDLINADAIQSFADFFAASPDKTKILALVEAQLQCSSSKTREAAKEFLGEYAQ